MNLLFVTLKPLEVNTSVTKSNIGLISGFRDLGYDIDIVMPEIDKTLCYYDACFDLSSFNVYRIKNQNVGARFASASSISTGLKQRVLGVARKVYYQFKVLDRETQLLDEAKHIDVYDNCYDYVVSTSDPKSSHLFVKRMIKRGLKYGKWIQHWGDPLASDITCHNIYPMFWKKIIEKRIIASADKIIYVSPFTFDFQKKQHKNLKNKMDFVPLPCDIYNGSIINQASGNSSLQRRQLKLTYLGDYHSSTRNIKPLYNVCKTNNKYSLVIAGNTDLSLAETENIKIFPRLSNKKVKELESESDVIISIGNLHGNQIPGKIYYAASSQKAILVVIDGEYKEPMKKYIDSFGRYECCENTEDSIEDALSNIYKSLIIGKNEKIYSVPTALLPINVAKKIIGK